MTLYESTKQELRAMYDKTEKAINEINAYYETKTKEFAEEQKRMNFLRKGIDKIAQERQVGAPWLAGIYSDFKRFEDEMYSSFLTHKAYPAFKAAEAIKEQSRLRRQAEKEKRIAEYIIGYYETIAPFLVDLKEEADLPTADDEKNSADYSEVEKQDAVINYLSKEEYRKLPSVERNQMALDRYWKRPKSKWHIGRIYERYIGYIHEKDGYDVEYVGIFKGYEDLGRDLVCKKANETLVIQCKYWSQFRTIYEKHIFQFFGTCFQYRDENPDKKIRPIFYTTTEVSELARRFAQALKIELKEKYSFDSGYPAIKCNVSKIDGTKIYHLPLDQQYDKVKIEPELGEFYCLTCKEAEDKGFRRAFRYKGKTT